MGVCLSKGGHPHHHHPHRSPMFAADDDGFCTPECVSSQYESPNPSGRYSFAHLETPRVSADVGDFGVLGSLFYKRGSRSRDFGGHGSNGSGGGLGLGMGSGLAPNFISPLDMFLGGVSGRNRVHHVNQMCTGDYSFASYLASPLLKGFDVHAMEEVAKSYAESAAKAAARDTFVFLEENDVSVTTIPCNGGRAEVGEGNASKLLSPVADTEGNEKDVDDDLAKSVESEDWHEPVGKIETWDQGGASGGDAAIAAGAGKSSGSSRNLESASPVSPVSPKFRAENARGTSDRWDSVLNAVQARAKARRRQRKRSVAEAAGSVGEGNERKIQGGRGRSKSVRFRLDSDEDGKSLRDVETTEGELSMTDEDFRSERESDFDEDRERGFLSDPSDIGETSLRSGAALLRRALDEEENGGPGAAAATPALVGEGRDGSYLRSQHQQRDGEAEEMGVDNEIKDAEFGGFSASEVLGGLRATASEVLDGVRVGTGEPTSAPVLETGVGEFPSLSPPRLQQHHHLHVHQPSRESFSSAESSLPETSFESSSHETVDVSSPARVGGVRAGECRAQHSEDDDRNEVTSGSSSQDDRHHLHDVVRLPQREGLQASDAAGSDAGGNFDEHADRGVNGCAPSDRSCPPFPTNCTETENGSNERSGAEFPAAAAAFTSGAADLCGQDVEAQDQQHKFGCSSSFVKDIPIANDLTAACAEDEEEDHGAGAGAGAGAGIPPAPPAIQVGCVVVETRMADGSRLNPQILDLKEVQLPERGEHNHGLFHPRILSGGEEEDEDYSGSDDPSSSADEEGGFSFPVLVSSSSATPAIALSSRPEKNLEGSFPSSPVNMTTATVTFREQEPPPDPPIDSAWEDARAEPLNLEAPIKSRTIRLYAPQLQHQQQWQPPSSLPISIKSRRDVQGMFSQGIFSIPQIADGGTNQEQQVQEQQHQVPAARSSFSFDVEPSVPAQEKAHEIVLPTLPSFSASSRSKPSPVFNPSPKPPGSSAASSAASSLHPAIQVSSIPYPAKARRTLNKKLKFYSLERASYAASGAKRSKSPTRGLSRDGQRGGHTSGETDGESESDLFEIETMSGTNAMGSSRTPPSTPTKGQSPPGPGSRIPSAANDAFDFEKLTDSIARVSRSRSKRKVDSSHINSRVASKAVHAEELQREGDGMTRRSAKLAKGSSGSSQSYLKSRALLKLGFLMRSNKQMGGQGRYPHSRSDHSRDADVCGSGETSASEYLENKPPSPGAAVSATPSARYHHHHHRGGSQCCTIVEEERTPHSGHHSFPQHQNYNTYAFDWYCSSMPHKVAPIVPQEKRQGQHQIQEAFTSHSRSLSNEDRTFAVKN